MASVTAPRWDLTNVYPALDSQEFKKDFEKIKKEIIALEALFAQKLAPLGQTTPPKQLADAIGELIDQLNEGNKLGGTIQAYIHSFVSTDSFNTLAKKYESEFDQVLVDLKKFEVKFKAWLGGIGNVLPTIYDLNPSTKAHVFYLQETVEQSRYLMSQAEEMLAATLGLSGATAWGKLQGTVTSQLSVEFELDGKKETLSMPALINLRSHPDEATRHRGYDAENEAWQPVAETLAACLNGVKGESITLFRGRGREDCLHEPIDQARIDRPTLEAMLGAMKDSFPMFRKYFNKKAEIIGKKKLAWWDLFAPIGSTEKTYSFSDAKDFILENFNGFSPELSNFAKITFDKKWIDAEQRKGKRGGAFCMEIPAVNESRILCNFDGSLDQVGTVAHEIGHAFHNYCAQQAGKLELQKLTPMTMAETASIMCETIINEAVTKQASTRDEKLAILDNALGNDSQVIVDIYSRFLFEKEVFEKREKGELSVDEINDAMLRAQKETYGNGLDDNYLQKYMWTWKPHYYYAALNFYNFPYAFGLLFGIGLYAIFQQQGASFIPNYKALLASTGEGKAADLAARFGIDLRSKKFWEDSIKVIEKRVDAFCKL
jgi:pepF/M3 family oligoendopeptidase